MAKYLEILGAFWIVSYNYNWKCKVEIPETAVLKNCLKLATDQTKKINKHLVTSTLESLSQQKFLYYIRVSRSSSSPCEIAPGVKSVVHAAAAHLSTIYFHLYLPYLDVCRIHINFALLQCLKMKETQSATTDMGVSRYTGRSQKHNCS